MNLSSLPLASSPSAGGTSDVPRVAASLRRLCGFCIVCAFAIVAMLAPSARASQILFYAGDWDFGATTNMRKPGDFVASLYQGFLVPSGVTWQVERVFFNSQLAFFANEEDRTTNVTTALWSIRSGMSVGNGGTVVASGSSAIALTPTGRSDAYGVEYTVSVSNLSVNLGAGTYWMNVTPVVTGTGNGSTYAGPSYGGANKVGSIAATNYFYSMYDTSGVGSNFTNQGSTRYSSGVVGNQISGVPEIDPAGMGSVLALVGGALGLLERRRLKAA